MFYKIYGPLFQRTKININFSPKNLNALRIHFGCKDKFAAAFQEVSHKLGADASIPADST